MTFESGVFWPKHLAGVARPLVHFLPIPTLDVAALTSACSQLGFPLFLVDVGGASSAETLMDSFSQAMRFPAHFGRNWDAFVDMLRDLSWKKAAGYGTVLLHADSLTNLEATDSGLLLEALEASVRDWRDERGEHSERVGAVPFHIFFSGSEALRQMLVAKLKEPLCIHQNESWVETIDIPCGVGNPETIGDARQLLESGAGLELVLSFLRERGLEKLNSAYAIAGLLETAYSVAWAFVDSSETWTDQYYPASAFREAARKALRELGFDDS